MEVCYVTKVKRGKVVSREKWRPVGKKVTALLHSTHWWITDVSVRGKQLSFQQVTQEYLYDL